MNKPMLMIGTTLLLYLLIITMMPSYDSNDTIFKIKHSSKSYGKVVNLISIILSIIINCLAWGWFF